MVDDFDSRKLPYSILSELYFAPLKQSDMVARQLDRMTTRKHHQDFRGPPPMPAISDEQFPAYDSCRAGNFKSFRNHSRDSSKTGLDREVHQNEVLANDRFRVAELLPLS